MISFYAEKYIVQTNRTDVKFFFLFDNPSENCYRAKEVCHSFCGGR